MEFIKNHYEKILLSVVLLGLAVVSALLPAKVKDVEIPQDQGNTSLSFKGFDIKSNETMIALLDNASELNWTGSHKVFNPEKWQRTPNGRLIKIESKGLESISPFVIENIVPLYLIISYDGVVGYGESLKYRLTVTDEANTNAALRRPQMIQTKLNERQQAFTLKSVVGPENDPTELILELVPDGQRASVSREKPFKKVSGYIADFRYIPDNRLFPRKRAGEQLVIGSETNNIVAIDKDSAILFSPITGIRTTVKSRTMNN